MCFVSFSSPHTLQATASCLPFIFNPPAWITQCSWHSVNDSSHPPLTPGLGSVICGCQCKDVNGSPSEVKWSLQGIALPLPQQGTSLPPRELGMFHCSWLSWPHTHLQPRPPPLTTATTNPLRYIFSHCQYLPPRLAQQLFTHLFEALVILKQKNSHVPLMWIWYNQNLTQTHCPFITLLSACLPVQCPVQS